MLGERLNPILEQISDTITEHQAAGIGRHHFPKDSVFYATNIFTAVIGEYAFLNMLALNMPGEQMMKLAETIGEDIRELVLKYTNIDTHKL